MCMAMEKRYLKAGNDGTYQCHCSRLFDALDPA